MNHSIQKRESSLPLGMRMSQVISRNAFSQVRCDSSNAVYAIETNNHFENSIRTGYTDRTAETSPSSTLFKKPKIPTTVQVPNRSPTSSKSSHLDLSNKYANMLDVFKQRSLMTQKSLCGSLNTGRVTRKSSTYHQLHNLNKTSNSHDNLHNFVRLYGNSSNAPSENILVNNQAANRSNPVAYEDADVSFYFTPKVENSRSVSPFEFSESPDYSPNATEPYIGIFDDEKADTENSVSPDDTDQVFSARNDSPTSYLNYFGNNNDSVMTPKSASCEKFYYTHNGNLDNWYEMSKGDGQGVKNGKEKIDHHSENCSAFEDNTEQIDRYFENFDKYKNTESSMSPFFISELLNSGSEVHFQHQFGESQCYNLHYRDTSINIEDDKENLLAPLVSFPKVDGTLVIEEVLREN